MPIGMLFPPFNGFSEMRNLHSGIRPHDFKMGYNPFNSVFAGLISSCARVAFSVQAAFPVPNIQTMPSSPTTNARFLEKSTVPPSSMPCGEIARTIAALPYVPTPSVRRPPSPRKSAVRSDTSARWRKTCRPSSTATFPRACRTQRRAVRS